MIDLRKLPAHLVKIPEEHWPEAPRGLARPIEVYCSRDYLVQVYVEQRGVYRLSVSSTRSGSDGRWTDGIRWDDLQVLKREAGFGDHWAVEIFPADLSIVNVANMRHLWVLEEAPDFAWRKR